MILALIILSITVNLYVLLSAAEWETKEIVFCILVSVITGICVPVISCLLLHAIFKKGL